MSTMTNPFVQNTIHLNGQGIQLLRQGNAEAAIVVFSNALKASKQLLGQAQALSSLSPSGTPLPLSPPGLCSRPVQHYVEAKQPQQLSVLPPTPVAPAEVGTEYVYEIPFQIILPCVDSCMPVTTSTAMPFVLTCMYNLALAHHARAVQLQDLAQFKTALQLYELAYSVLSGQKRTLPISSMMMLAILNNLAQVHLRIGNAYRSRRCMSHLLSLLVYVRERGGCGPGQSLDGFFSNTADVVLSGPATAQAA